MREITIGRTRIADDTAPWVIADKKCSACGEVKTVTEFWRWRRLCKACDRQRNNAYTKKRRTIDPVFRAKKNARSRAWALAHPDIVRERARRGKLKTYGITPEQEKAIRLAQGGKCAFGNCERPATDVDHILMPDGCPWVRGILCHDHNIALGSLHDSIQEARDAAAFLEADARRRFAVV